jgi:DNA-directed RNA polymerase specialized sigma subunit
MKEERNRKILELHLRAWNTQKSIADILGVTQGTVNGVIEQNIKNQDSLIFNNDELKIYNIWNLP